MFHSKELGGKRQAQEPKIFRRWHNGNFESKSIKAIFANSQEELELELSGHHKRQLHPTYDEVIAIGFKREIASDDVFENQHGYSYFLVNYEAKNLIIEWDVLSHELTLTVADQLIGRITFDKAKAIIEELDRPKQD
jgi:RNAse (barnase) inhibitor barstar